jgi:hypothetical protein
MLDPHQARSSISVTSRLVTQNLATGNSFGSSSLKIVRYPVLVFSIANDVAGARSTHPPQSSSLVIEVGKIILLALWFWCAIGANFCADLISDLVGIYTQDA